MSLRRSVARGAAVAWFASTASGGATLHTNLVVNGDAETGDETGWSPGGLIEANLSTVAGGLGLPAGVSIGGFSFHAGLGDPIESMEQSVGLTALAVAIDSGEAIAEFAGLVQSRTLDTLVDAARVRFLIEDAGGSSLLTREYVDPSTPSGVYDWHAFSESVAVPVGARAVRIVIVMTRTGGASTDGFVDNLTLILRGPGVCPGDIDGDGDIDFTDLNLLLGAFNTSGVALPGDFDGDGDVDFADLNTLLNGFNTACP